ncbi:hypothetical protein PDJAM_G00114170 [Pangasius djambal]|uniref:Uncharacterized protein n=1 Tax=Pangasius djambal TaxID=1691987 RepID=A0ACC5Y4D8_9TELE|nr:hypothetical protein [Pangasius djambal]
MWAPEEEVVLRWESASVSYCACAAGTVSSLGAAVCVGSDCVCVGRLDGRAALAESVQVQEVSSGWFSFGSVTEVVFVDGNGLFHYREFGLACHLGVLSDLPCVGVAKNLLQVQGVVKNDEHMSQISALSKAGDTFPLVTDSGKILGQALRSSDRSTKPVYVSVGHRISLDTAVRLTHSCCRYRVPEPTRQADLRSREYLRTHFPSPS